MVAAFAFHGDGLAPIQVGHDSPGRLSMTLPPGQATSIFVTCGCSSFRKSVSIFSRTSCSALMMTKVPRPSSADLRINQLFGAEPMPTVKQPCRSESLLDQAVELGLVADTAVGDKDDLPQV